MTDLTDRLRQHAQLHQHHTVQDDEQIMFANDLLAAAAENAALREQVRVLREALETIVMASVALGHSAPHNLLSAMDAHAKAMLQASAALEQTK